ncbi:MAG: hypothetical protein ACLPQ6_03470 [Steroidobacteraceae bacterium]
MDLTSVVYLGVLISLLLSTILSVVMLPPIRSVLRRVCPADDAVALWTRFTVLMLFLGPMIVTLVFGVPNGGYSSKLTDTDLVIRVITAALVGSFLTLGGIGIRLGTLRPNVVAPPVRKRTDDELIK